MVFYSPWVGQRFPLLASTRVYGILFLLTFFSIISTTSSTSPCPTAAVEVEGRERVSERSPRGSVGGVNFLRLGGRGAGVVEEEEGGWNASSSEEGEEGEESEEEGDCFTRRLLRRVTDFASESLAGFLGRGLLGGVGGAREEDEEGDGPLDAAEPLGLCHNKQQQRDKQIMPI